MVDGRGQPKEMRRVLEERGVNTTGMKADKMREVLGNFSDFRYKKTKVERYLENERIHRVIFLPKFHCEFNPIERVWGQAKKTTRATCKYSFKQLK